MANLTSINPFNYSSPGLLGHISSVFRKQTDKLPRSKAVSLQNRYNRLLGVKQVGITKPTAISFSTLRRIADVDTVIRICINVIKKEVSQSKWIIKKRDEVTEINGGQKKAALELFNFVNFEKENLRTLLDRIIEDSLVLDAAVIELLPNINKEIVALNSVDGACYSDDTEVLTKEGWKLFKDVDIEKDLFATRNQQTKEFEWQKGTYFHHKKYDGEFYRFYSRSLDLLVSPSHRMLVTCSSGKKIFAEKIITAEEASKYTCRCLPAVSNWTGVYQEFFELKGNTNGNSIDYKWEINDFAAFMGMYLSEGSIEQKGKQNRIYISQLKESKGFASFKELLIKMFGKEPYYDGSSWQFRNKPLWKYLQQFGKATEKFIPEDILNLPKEQLAIFWEYYVLGDGCFDGNRESIITSSKEMADDMQELLQKLGYSASISQREPKHDIYIEDRVILKENQHISYMVRLRTSKTQHYNSEKIHYKGDIYCVSVPNEILYVRRNNKPIWCGNTIRPHINMYGEFGDPAYYQVIHDKKVAEFSKEEIIYIMANPQNDVYRFGYGMCVPYNTRIHTKEHGNLFISEVVNKKMKVEVKTYDKESEKIVYKPIVNWYSRDYYNYIYRVDFACGGKGNNIRCTEDHPILTTRGYIKAKDIRLDDKVMVESSVLTRDQKEMIYGSLLGDMSLKNHSDRKNVGIPCIAFAHSNKQKEYFNWKLRHLRNLSTVVYSREQKSPHYETSGTLVKCSFCQTKSSYALWNIYENCYRDNQKRVTKEWLDNVGELGFAVWVMDDGYISKDSHITLCTDNFSIEECKLIIKWLKDKFNFEASILCPPSTNKPRIRITPYKEILTLLKKYISLENREERKGNLKLWIAQDIKVGKEKSVVSVSIKAIAKEKQSTHRSVYDIEVQDTHNFLVNGAVVHNSPIESIILTVQTSLDAEVYNSSLFVEDNVPPGILHLGNVMEDEAEAIKELWNAQVTGHTQKLRFTYGAEKLQYFPFKNTNKDMQYTELLDRLTRLKLARYGLSAMDANITQDVNKSTADIQRSISNARGVLDMKNLISESFNRWIFEPMGWDTIEFDFEKTISLEEQKTQAEIDKIYVTETGIITEDEVRDRMGLPELERVEIMSEMSVVPEDKKEKVEIKDSPKEKESKKSLITQYAGYQPNGNKFPRLY